MKQRLLLISTLLFFFTIHTSSSQHSTARMWNEVLLEGIRNDYARPTVHARNLFHISAAMYDCWAVYAPVANPYFLGRDVGGFTIEFDGVPDPNDAEAATSEALSYACYRLINHRFEYSPGADETLALADDLMATLGYNTEIVSQDYSTGSAAALGNYLAMKIIDFGLQDGSNEVFDYDNLYYEPVNPDLIVANPGNETIEDPNRWQPLAFEVFVDQSGNEIPGNAPEFLSPEWGNALPFALTDEDATIYTRDGDDYIVYHDPGPPAYIDPTDNSVSGDYKWGFSLVSIWSSHLDPTDGTNWDISPAGIGNLKLEDLPQSHDELMQFYNRLEGGDPGNGYTVNPKTGMPYEAQMVPRGDYSRVLAEFWADGPDSETPPGHWFTILNYVNDHQDLVKKFKGSGDIIPDLEWDIKSYFTLGGAMHDAAISAWGIKGYYDYIRPVSAIRYMADQGQSSDPDGDSYNQAGIPLAEGYIELVLQGDALAGENDEHVGKIKLKAWKGPDYIDNPEIDEAGVDWILAENWWPYQRPTFVTPPFAGYVSGHSTYSRAAAKVLTSLTGDEYFPGGVGEFEAPKNEFLVFEEGPSVDVTLQWAKYNDASDQCSLSRIWGGIHPPVDDIPGRLIGEEIGSAAFEYAEKFFNGRIILGVKDNLQESIEVFPNPAKPSSRLNIKLIKRTESLNLQWISLDGKVGHTQKYRLANPAESTFQIEIPKLNEGVYLLKAKTDKQLIYKRISIGGN
ncbi:MAG: T9SS type A sorting domain-containing protein [Cyclobacteriaceae bacterium]